MSPFNVSSIREILAYLANLTQLLYLGEKLGLNRAGADDRTYSYIILVNNVRWEATLLAQMTGGATEI